MTGIAGFHVISNGLNGEPSANVMLLSGSCTHDALMNGSPPPPPETVAPVEELAAETNVAGIQCYYGNNR